MSVPRVLLLGGHGKVSMLLTPILLSKSWNVTSVIRDPKQENEILKLGEGKKGKVNVLINSLDDVKTEADAQKVIDTVKPDYVIWSAGAGGKGGPSRTYAIDQDAAKYYISSSIATPSVTKFLMVSFIASRKGRAPWWTDEDWESAEYVKSKVLPDYYKAKVEADEHLVALAKTRRDGGDSRFQAINLRPGTLSDVAPTGKVRFGKTSSKGKVSRGDVAATAAALLGRDDTRGWYDLLEGTTPIEQAVDEAVKSGHDGIEGEDLDRIYSRTS